MYFKSAPSTSCCVSASPSFPAHISLPLPPSHTGWSRSPTSCSDHESPSCPNGKQDGEDCKHEHDYVVVEECKSEVGVVQHRSLDPVGDLVRRPVLARAIVLPAVSYVPPDGNLTVVLGAAAGKVVKGLLRHNGYSMLRPKNNALLHLTNDLLEWGLQIELGRATPRLLLSNAVLLPLPIPRVQDGYIGSHIEDSQHALSHKDLLHSKRVRLRVGVRNEPLVASLPLDVKQVIVEVMFSPEVNGSLLVENVLLLAANDMLVRAREVRSRLRHEPALSCPSLLVVLLVNAVGES
mmetsp:Transcript_7265/g.30902  ORF Transcript_7265/g.30902 Transcript_7265/m.30902 type:complete len:293 (+) Transcript_7265:1-879(+)